MGKEFKNKILNNATWLIVCQIVQAILSFFIGTISAQYLGPSNYGLISYATSMVTFLVPLVQLGIRHTLVQEIINNPDYEGEILGTTLGMTAISSILGMVGMISFVWIVNQGDYETILVCSLYSITLLFQSLTLIQYWFQAKWMAKYTAITSLIAYIVISSYRIFLLVTGKSVYWFAMAHAVDYAVIAIVLLSIYKRKGLQRLSISMKTALKIFSKSKYYIISGLMVCLYTQTDHIMLTIMLGKNENGIYNAALNCVNVSGFIFAAIIDSVRPAIFQAKKENQIRFEEGISRLYSVIIYLAIIQSLFFVLFATPIISILYGAEYKESIAILRILTWYPAFSYMGTVRNIWILSEDRQKVLWRINMSGAVLNVIGNIILIPLYGGKGAAIATIITQIFTNFILCIIIKKLRYNLKLIKNGLNPMFIIKEIKQVFGKRKESK